MNDKEKTLREADSEENKMEDLTVCFDECNRLWSR